MHLLMSSVITEDFRAAAFHFLSLGFQGVILWFKKNQHGKKL